MKVDIQYRPAFALAIVELEPKEPINVEAGAMVAMSPDMEMETQAKGGFLSSLSRSVLAKETFFINTYTGNTEGDTIALAPALPGDIAVIEMSGETIMVQSGSYMASSAGIKVETKWSGAKTFFGAEGLIMLRVSGTGTLIVSSYGAIRPLELGPGEVRVIDTGHIVTFEERIKFDVTKVAGWKSTLFSGEGLVIRLTGPGKATLQSRSQDAFLSWLIPKIPQKSN